MKFFKKFIGDRQFYKSLILLMVPMILQNGITTFVGLLDNIMVGRVGMEEMSGVAIGNQLMFIFNLCVFGGMSGAGIFGAQFHGKGDHTGVRNVLRIKIWLCAILTLIGFVVFTFFDEFFIGLYLHEGSETGNLMLTMQYGKQYLSVTRWLLLPFSLVQAYASTLRETGETVPQMRASVTAVIINCLLNWVLIFGNLGAPKLGVVGAALATLIARLVEFLIIVVWTHSHPEINLFTKGLFRSFRVPGSLLKHVFVQGTPLLINELVWSTGIAFLNQCYSVRGLAAVAATNITGTLTDFFNIIMSSIGAAISIIVGNYLGANKMAEARDADNKLIAFSFMSCCVTGGVLALLAPVFANMYNTSEEVKQLAVILIRIAAMCIPIHSISHAAYFTIRSGGKTVITFIFDSVIMWVTQIPVVALLVYLTDIPIEQVYFFGSLTAILKSAAGIFLVKSDMWMQNIVDETGIQT